MGTCRRGNGFSSARAIARAVRLRGPPGATRCPSGSADGARGMGPARRRFPDAVAAAWQSPPPSLAFSLSGGTFEVSPHRTILCAKAGCYPGSLRDGPLELLGLLWPSIVRVRSRGALARRGLPRALPHRYAQGTTLRKPLSPVGPRSRAPPRRRGSPRAGGETCAQMRCRASEPLQPGRARLASRRVDRQNLARASLRAHRSAGPMIEMDSRQESACRCRTSSSVRSLGAPSDLTGARPLPRSCPLFGRSVPPDPLVPSAWFDPHLGDLLRALVPRLSHLVPALTPLSFRRRAPADRRWLPSCAR
jgi:hypothetical protein